MIFDIRCQLKSEMYLPRLKMFYDSYHTSISCTYHIGRVLQDSLESTVIIRNISAKTEFQKVHQSIQHLCIVAVKACQRSEHDDDGHGEQDSLFKKRMTLRKDAQRVQTKVYAN